MDPTSTKLGELMMIDKSSVEASQVLYINLAGIFTVSVRSTGTSPHFFKAVAAATNICILVDAEFRMFAGHDGTVEPAVAGGRRQVIIA